MNLPLPDPPRGILTYEDVRVRFDRFTEGNEEKGFAPGYHFLVLTPDSIVVGHVNIRVGNSEHVLRCAGHVGFAIHAQHRGKKYASKACMALAGFVPSILESVILTADPDNLASIRTIEKIGGVFIDEVSVPEGDPHYARGSRRKMRYHWALHRVEQAGALNEGHRAPG